MLHRPKKSTFTYSRLTFSSQYHIKTITKSAFYRLKNISRISHLLSDSQPGSHLHQALAAHLNLTHPSSQGPGQDTYTRFCSPPLAPTSGLLGTELSVWQLSTPGMLFLQRPTMLHALDTGKCTCSPCPGWFLPLSATLLYPSVPGLKYCCLLCLERLWFH